MFLSWKHRAICGLFVCDQEMDSLYPRYGNTAVVPNWQTYLSLHPGIERETLNVENKQVVSLGERKSMKSSQKFVLFASKIPAHTSSHFSSWGTFDKFCDNRLKEKKYYCSLQQPQNVCTYSSSSRETCRSSAPGCFLWLVPSISTKFFHS